MPSRISGACNGCRSKKQKCSGDKDGCVQCEAAGIPCTWPEQRKRGPAKGYIEGLEHRLHEAESLLLQILPYISTEQLHTATTRLTDHDDEDTSGGSPGRRSSPALLNKKTGIDYWESFPLTSIDDIRRWQQDCEVNHTIRGNNTHVKFESRHSSPRVPDSRPNRLSMTQPQTQQSRNHMSLTDLYSIQQDQPMQGIQPQTSQMRMSLDHSQHARWQDTNAMMGVGAPLQQRPASIPQNASLQGAQFMNDGMNLTSWQMQQNMQINTTGTEQSQQDAFHTMNSQAHSHLFW